MVSKALKEPREKPPPFPYLDKPFRFVTQMYDRCTPRLDENSKLVVVEGAPAIGKSQFAQDLADQFDMVYMGPPNMDEIYVDYYGVDYRKYNEYFPDWYKTFDEKDFCRNPLGGATDTTCDRYHAYQYFLKWLHQLKAIRHILNTGQGVVMEKGANADYIYLEAAYQQGWITPESKN